MNSTPKRSPIAQRTGATPINRANNTSTKSEYRRLEAAFGLVCDGKAEFEYH